MSAGSTKAAPADDVGGTRRRRAAAVVFAVLGGGATLWAGWLALADGFERPLVGIALGLALIAANLAPVVAVSGGRIDAFTPVGALLVPIGLLLPLPDAVLVYALGEGLGVLAAHRWDRHVGGPETDAAARTTWVIGKSIAGAVLGLVALKLIADSDSAVPAQVLAALAAVAVSTAFDHTMVALLGSLVEGRRFVDEFLRGIGELSMVAGSEVVAGSLIAVLAGRDPWSLLLGLAMLGLLLVAGSAYARAAADRHDTGELLRLAGELQEAHTPGEVEAAALASVRRLLPDDLVAIRPEPPGEGERGWLLGEGDDAPRWLVTPRIVDIRDYEQQPTAIVEAAVSLARVAMSRAATQEQLIEQDRLRALILSTVAHDLRSPLAVASGGLEMLTQEESDLEPEQRSRLLAASARAVDRIRRLIDDLLGLERTDRRATDEATDVPSVIEKLVAELDVGAVEVELQLAAASAAIDAVSLERIVENLVMNAAKYSPPGGAVTVTSGTADGQVEVVVRDQGPGVAREDRAAVFEPFQQRDRRAGGVGLGLYVTRRFVETHDGRIWVDDAPGGGAAFHVRLPAATG